jgi:hypothetical protein
VHSNLCDESHVGGGMAPILRRIPAQNKAQAFAKFTVPYYVSVGVTSASNVRVYINTENGGPPSLQGQVTWCTLHILKAVCSRT